MEKKKYEEIFKGFPAIEKIKDSDLREKVLKAWARALKEGSFRRLEDIPFSVEICNSSLQSHITG